MNVYSFHILSILMV